MPIVRLADLPIFNNSTAGSFVTLIDPATGNVFRAEKDTLLTGSFDGTASFALVAEYALNSSPTTAVTSFNTRVGAVTLQSTDIAGLGAGILSSSAFSSPSQGTLRATVNGVQTDVDLGLQTGDSVSFNTVTATLNGNASTATTATTALTASSADNFVVRQGLTGSNALFTGAITAQTLVVQTVTSSIVYSSGSNRFGNQLTDVQQMTGSVRITGSLSVNGTSVPTGTGTSGQVAYWTDSGITGEANLFWDATNDSLKILTSRYNDSLTFNATAGFILGGTIRQLSINTNDTSPYNISFQAKTNANTASDLVFNSLGGNVGIGTTSPSYKLDVSGTGRFTSDVTATLFTGKHYTGATYNFEGGYLGKSTSNGGALLELVAHTDVNPASSFALRHDRDISGNLLFQYASPQTSYSSLSYTALAQLTTDGNLGLGVTPSAWFSVYKALQIGSYGAAISGQTNDQSLTLWNNAYPDASNVDTYTTTNAANKFRMDGGAFKWFTAPPGTATQPITFTQAMTLDSSGRLGIGTTNPTELLHISSIGKAKIKITADTDNIDEADNVAVELSQDGGISTAIFGMTPDGANHLVLGANSTTSPNIYIATRNDGTNFVTSSDAKVTILNSGNVGIGTTSPSYPLTRNGITLKASGTDGAEFVILSSADTGFAGAALIRTGTDFTVYNRTNGVLAFGTNDTTRMTITSGGKVGIGTTSPSATLTVSGSNNILILTSSNDNQSFEITFNSNANSFFEAFNEQGETAWYNYTYSGSYRYDFIGYDGMFFRYGHPYGQSNIMETFATRSSPFLFSYYAGGSNEANATLDMEIRDHRWVGVNGNSFAKFTSSGSFAISDSGTYYEMQSKVANSPIIRFRHSGTTQPIGMWVEFSAASPDNNTEYFFRGSDSTTDRIYIYSDGDLANHDGVYGSISDIKLKQDIVDATAQWDDIKNIRFRKYRLKKDVEINPNAPYLLGVVAQELELTSPGLVESHPDFEQVEVPALSENGEQLKDREGNLLTKLIDEPTGTYTKTVKSSILLMKSAKALQEAIERIEALEAKVTELESKL